MGTINKVIIIIVLLFSAAENIYSQQDPLFSKYMFNPLFVNPAYAGSRETISSVLLYRAQWVGFDDAPNTQTFSVHSPLAQKKMGVGVSIIRDQLGPSVTHGILGAYAYRIKMLDGKLSFALRGALYNYGFDWSKIDYKNNETNLLTQQINYWMPSFDFGLRFHNKSSYVGLTFSHLNQPSIQRNEGIDSLTNTFQLIPHAILTAGKAFKMSDDLVLKPSVLVNTSTSLITTADFNFSALLKNVFWVGASYRTSKTIVAMIQYDLNPNISVGYSYDITLNKLINYNSGSHEFFLRYDLDYKKSKILSPRYF